MSLKPYKHKVITAGSPTANWGNVTLDDNVSYYLIEAIAPLTLTDNWEIVAIGAPVEGMVIKMYYNGNVAINGFAISIFGVFTFSAYQAQKKYVIDCVYKNAQWNVYIVEDYAVVPYGIQGTDVIDMSDGFGNLLLLNPQVDEKYQIVLGTNTLTGSYEIDGINAVDGDEFLIKYEASMMYDSGFTITIFGLELTASEALNGLDKRILVHAKYSTDTADPLNPSWHSTMIVYGGTAGETEVDNVTIDLNGSNQIQDKLWDYGGAVNSIKNRSNAATNTGIGSLSLGNTSLCSGERSLAMGKSLLTGIIEAKKIGSFAGGYLTGAVHLQSNGVGAFSYGGAISRSFINSGAYSFAMGVDHSIATGASYSSILGGTYHTIGISGNSSSIIGGAGHIVNHQRCAILGGNAITTRQMDTAYVEYLDFKDVASTWASSIRDVPEVPASARAHFLLDEVAIYQIRLDDWYEPEDNTDLDATDARHGLLMKLSGDSGTALLGDGTWGVIGGPGGVGTMSNVGTGEGEVYKDKTVLDEFRLRSLKQAGSLDISTGANEITITAPAFGHDAFEIPDIATSLVASNIVMTDGDIKLVSEAPNTAFNTDFGVEPGDTPNIGAELDPLSVVMTDAAGYLVTETELTAHNKDFGGTGDSDMVAHSNHTHLIGDLGVIYDAKVTVLNNSDAGTLITFSTPFAEAQVYSLSPYCYDDNGSTVDFVITARTKDGFTIIPAVDAIFDYQAFGLPIS